MRLVGITKQYKNVLYENLSYNFEVNKVYSIFADNGAGKTTLLKIMSNQTEPNEGYVEHDNKGIMFISDVFTPFEYLTGREYVEYTLKLKNIRYSQEKISELTEKMKLDDYFDVWIKNYSKGMKYKLLMIIVILSDADIILLDEPFVDLDMASKKIIADILKEYKKNKTIIFTTHIIEIATEFSDKILYLAQSKFEEIDNVAADKVREFVNNHMSD